MPAVNDHSTTWRRGAALLWTLAVLVLTLTATLSVAQLAATAASRRGLDRSESLAGALLPAAEQAIMHWLQHQSSKAVVPPDVGQPQVLVLNDLIVLDDRRFHLTITAFDQSGMVPLRAILAGSPLRLAMDEDLLCVVDQCLDHGPLDDVPLGLDLLAAAADGGRVVFPRPARTAEADSTSPVPARFAASGDQAPSILTITGTIAPSHTVIPFGAILSTHTTRIGPINVNTAPAWLLEAALRQAGRGGLDQILDNRAADPARSSPVPNLPGAEAGVAAGAQPSDQSSMPTFVSVSDVWSFRIDARCAMHDREGGFIGASWWAVYQRSSSSTTPWTCVQRLAITD